jgi:hypothetical protein
VDKLEEAERASMLFVAGEEMDKPSTYAEVVKMV